jgi:hypothetical protein
LSAVAAPQECREFRHCPAAVRDFIAAGQDGIGSVIGIKVDPRTNTLWANSLSNTEGSGVFHYDLATGRLIRKYVFPDGVTAAKLIGRLPEEAMERLMELCRTFRELQDTCCRAHVLSIAALYSPQRAARLHRAR